MRPEDEMVSSSALEEEEQVLGEEIQAPEDETAALAEELRQYQERMLRLQADFDNYRKRTRREMEELVQLANADLVKGFLPVLDNMERALQAGAQAGAAAVLEGVQLIYRQLLDLLQKEGLQAIEAQGQPFDPVRHHAVLRSEEETDYPVDTVMEELQRGYALNGRVLRPALVKVAPAGGREVAGKTGNSSSDEEDKA